MADFNQALGNVGASAYGAGQMVSQVGIIVGAVLPFAILAVFLIYIFKHNIKTTIIETRGGKVYQTKDTWSRKIIGKDEVVSYKLMFRRIHIQPPPNFTNVFLRGKHDRIFIFKHSDDDYQYLGINTSQGFFPVRQDMKLWMLQQLKKGREKYLKESFWNKYGAQILHIGSMVFMLIVMTVIVYKMDALVGVSSNIVQAKKLELELEQIRIAANACGGLAGIPPPG